MRKIAWSFVIIILFVMYYLSSIPGLRVVPVFKQVNDMLDYLDISMVKIAKKIAAWLPERLDPARTMASDFWHYLLRDPAVLEYFLRKSAHVVLFFIMTIVIFFLLRQYFDSVFITVPGAFVLGTALAFLDEYHQTLVDNRSGNLTDVGIDMVGVTLAVIFIICSLLITMRRKA